MMPVIAETQFGSVKVFTTDNGAHTPEMVAKMSMHSLLDKDSNPVKAKKIEQTLVELYAEAQRAIRVLFQMVADEKTITDREILKAAIIQIISRDFNTALDIERKMFKEK